MSLSEQLAEMRAKSVAEKDEADVQTILKDLEQLEQSGIVKSAPKDGEKLADFTLPNHNGEIRELAELRKNGPVVITFYRGGWCPYCNLELRAYQQALPEIKAAGATLVAITPELPDESMSTAERHNLEFEVLTDAHSEYGKEINIVFTLDEAVRPTYEKFGIDLEKHNGTGQFDLPMGATFVVDTEGTIVCSHVDVDFMKRAEPSDVVKVLQSLKQ